MLACSASESFSHDEYRVITRISIDDEHEHSRPPARRIPEPYVKLTLIEMSLHGNSKDDNKRPPKTLV